MDSLELVEPFLSDLVEQRLISSVDAGRTGGTKLCPGQIAVFGQRAVSVAAANIIVLTKEKCCGDALSATGRKCVGQVRVLIPVEESQVDRIVRRGDEVVEDRALVDAVSAPGSGDDEHFHFSDKARQDLQLNVRQVDLFVNGGPTLLLIFGTVFGEKFGVAEAAFEFRGEVHVVVFRRCVLVVEFVAEVNSQRRVFWWLAFETASVKAAR